MEQNKEVHKNLVRKPEAERQLEISMRGWMCCKQCV